MANKTLKAETLVKIGSDSGHTVVNKNSALRRLNYFDGKFLRAPDLILEQQALLNQVRLSNQAGGAGIVHGYDCTLSAGDSLQISGGFAIDFGGRALLSNDVLTIGIEELIERSRSSLARASSGLSGKQPGIVKVASSKNRDKVAGFEDCVIHSASAIIDGREDDQLYLITLNHAEAFCGQEDVFGKLCSEACSTSTSHSYVIEGIEVRAVPLNLSRLLKQSSAVPLSQAHLRSRVASAFFAEERDKGGSHISAAGLSSMIWCLSAEAAAGNGIPIAVLGRSGTSTLFLDAWTARRERMPSPPRHYWAGRMAMRPWHVYLAQILQFQCQLRGCLTSRDPEAPCKPLKDFDPCADTREAAREASVGMRQMIDGFGEMAARLAEFGIENGIDQHLKRFDGGLARLEQQYQTLVDSGRVRVPNRLLINCGIVEVPSAGYLPVNVSSTVSVNEQVQRLLGEGLDLRFCVVRPDFAPHALEEAQHMDRICLLSGIDDPAQKPKVDVLVPNGEIVQQETAEGSKGYQAEVSINSEVFDIGWPRKVGLQASDALLAEKAATATEGLSINTNYNTVSQAINRLAIATARDLPPMSGVGRSEALESSGAAFFLAARSGIKVQAARATLSVAEAASQSVLSLLDGQFDSAPTTEAAVAYSTGKVGRLSSGLRINNAAISTLVPTTSMWVDLKCEHDPFSLNAGDSTDVRARLTMVVARNIDNITSLIIEERNVSGQLQIQKSAPQTADTRFTARLLANGIWSETRIFGNQPDSRSEAIKLDETVIVSRNSLSGLPPTISVAIVNPSFFGKLDNVQLVFERIWVSPIVSRVRSILRYQGASQSASKGKDVEASLKTLAQVQRSSEVVFSEIDLTEDQDVLKPGNQFHSAALGALDNIGKATKDSGFRDQAGKLLFPPAKPASVDLRILAHEPWVLFHRRRDKICATATAEQELVKPRRYRVYHVHLPSHIEVDELTAALSTDASAVIARFDAKPVTTVDYAPGLATVTTAHDDVRADWQTRVQVDADLHIGLIASEGEVIDDGEVLAGSRLQGLTDLLAPVSESADDLALLSVSEVPPTLAAGELDGVIVYFTRTVATVCHAVYRVVSRNSDEIVNRLEKYLQATGGESLPSFIQELGAEPLPVSPRFLDDGDKYFGANEAQQLASAWDLVNDGPVSRAVSFGSDSTDELQLITRMQTAKISQTVGSAMSADSVSYMTGPANIFKPCPKASLLMAEIDCNDVYFYSPPVQEQDQLVIQLTEYVTGVGITADVLASSPGALTHRTQSVFTHFNAVDFYRQSDQFEASSRQQFLLQWQSEINGVSPASVNGFYMCVARAGANDEETAANLAEAKAQGVKLQQLMGINSGGVHVATNNINVNFPVNCKVLTLLVVLRNFNVSFVAATHAVATAARATASSGDTNTATVQPALTVELARNVTFDENNEVVRDERFLAALEKAAAQDNKVKSLDLVSIDSKTDADAEARAKALLKVLKEEGVANNNAKLVIRAADEKESAEIIRSGFLLNRGMVLG